MCLRFLGNLREERDLTRAGVALDVARAEQQRATCFSAVTGLSWYIIYYCINIVIHTFFVLVFWFGFLVVSKKEKRERRKEGGGKNDMRLTFVVALILELNRDFS